MTNIRLKIFVMLVSTMLIAGCHLRARLALSPDSTISNMTFLLTAWSNETQGNLREFNVARCIENGSKFPTRGEKIWSISLNSGGEPPRVQKIIYGQQLSGFKTLVQPMPIESGCYIVNAYADFPDPRIAVLLVRVSEDGKITGDDNF